MTEAPSPPRGHRTPRRLLLALALALAGTASLAAIAWFSVELRLEERERAIHSWRSRLEAVADARKRAVQTWLAERRSDAEVLAWDPDLVGLCAEGTCPKGREPIQLRTHLDNLQRFAGFLGAYLFTPRGELLLAAEAGRHACSMSAVVARRVAREGRYLLHDLHAAEDGTPMVGFLAPVFARPAAATGESSEVIGVAGLYLDPRNTLFPVVVGTEAGTGTSTEVYLVRRFPGVAEIFTPVRSPPPQPEGLRLPLEDLRSAEVAALEAKETVGWFSDYRGRSVLASVRWISEAGWGLVAKVDEDEALAGWRHDLLREVGLLAAGLLCLLFGGVAAQRTWAGRRYRLLLEEIRDREERLQALATGSDDVVFIADPGGRFLLANRAASRVLGAGAEELPGRRSDEFLPAHVAEALRAHDRQALESGRPFQGEETIPVGGEERTFLASRIPIRDGQGRVRGVAGVLRDITERKRSEQALARWAQTLGALYKLGRGLTVAASADDVLRAVLDGAVAALGADVATLYLAEPSRGDLVLADGRGLDPSFREAFARVPPSHELIGRVLETGEVVAVEDYRSHPSAVPEAARATGARSLAAVPLRAEGEVLGVLSLGFRQVRRLGKDEGDALAVLGHMAGVALERARAREALEAEAGSRRRAESRLRRLHDATAGLTGDRLFAAVVQALAQELGVRWAAVMRVDAGSVAVPLAAVEDGEPVAFEPFPLTDTLCGDVVKTGAAVYLARGGTAPGAPGRTAFSGRLPESYVGVPLVDARREVVGVLAAFHDRPLSLGDPERDLIDLYGRRVGGEVERILAQQRLAEARRALETLIRNLPGAVYRCAPTPARAADYVSAGCEAVTGYPASALAGGSARALSEIVVPEDRPRVWREIGEAVAAGRAYEVEYRIHDARGGLRWVYDVGRAVQAPDGSLDALEGMLFDHTERRSLEAQLTHSQRMEALGRLAGGVAHDFNNLLTAISGYAEMLALRLPEGERARRAAQEIVRASDRAADLTRQLLAFSRRQVVEPKVLDLSEAAADTARMLERLLGEDVVFSLDLRPDAGAVRADPGQVEQVILNLAVNARDAMPEGGELSLRTYPAAVAQTGGEVPQGRYAVLEVEDTGVGMPPEVLEHIFEPFFTTKEEGKGTGLGLASVYGIVRQAGGRVTVASAPGQGSTFRVFWPRWADRTDEKAPQDHRARGGAGESVVLVEDEAAVREVAAEHLEDCGYRVAAFSSAAEALEAVEAGQALDVLVTDVVMPGLSGPELVRRLRERWPSLPVVLVSGHTGEAVVRLETEDPRSAFLQKPFRLADLGRAVAGALGKPPTPDP